MKMYRVGFLSNIEEREVIRETEQCVFFFSEYRPTREVREAKRDTWFATWDTAHAFILLKANCRVDSAQQSLERHLANLKKVTAMTAEIRK